MHAQVYSSIRFLSDNFKGILLDAYGVFWGGNNFGMLPNAKEAMQSLVSNDKIVGILSNSTQLASKEKEKFQPHGIIEGQHFHFIVTSGELAKEIFHKARLPFNTPKKTYWLLGKSHPRFSSHHVLFENSSFKEVSRPEEADFIYISIPHKNGEDQTDINCFRSEALEAVKMQLPIVCPNPDHFAHEGTPPRAVVRQGSLAALCEEHGGQVFYIGKPATLAYEAAMQEFSSYKIVQPSDILMVGDTPETDIRGARNFGMRSALVTQTGIMADRIERFGLNASLENLPSTDLPDFLIERFH